jgi:hypothetical protein
MLRATVTFDAGIKKALKSLKNRKKGKFLKIVLPQFCTFNFKFQIIYPNHPPFAAFPKPI